MTIYTCVVSPNKAVSSTLHHGYGYFSITFKDISYLGYSTCTSRHNLYRISYIKKHVEGSIC